jgi:hypothetical protein
MLYISYMTRSYLLVTTYAHPMTRVCEEEMDIRDLNENAWGYSVRARALCEYIDIPDAS